MTTQHGDRGHIIDVALGFAGSTLVDRVAIELMCAFGNAEPDHDISKYPTSYVATFADMARAVVGTFSVAERTADVEVRRHDA